jgi:hypothetical protein
VTIEVSSGPRAGLRASFERAENSALELARCIDAGVVLLTVNGGEIIGHVQSDWRLLVAVDAGEPGVDRELGPRNAAEAEWLEHVALEAGERLGALPNVDHAEAVGRRAGDLVQLAFGPRSVRVDGGKRLVVLAGAGARPSR